MIPPKRFDICPPLTEGCSEGLDAFRFFFKSNRKSRCVKIFLLKRKTDDRLATQDTPFYMDYDDILFMVFHLLPADGLQRA